MPRCWRIGVSRTSPFLIAALDGPRRFSPSRILKSLSFWNRDRAPRTRLLFVLLPERSLNNLSAPSV
jgi:hypothetical protein